MKRCFNCGEEKPLRAYYRHPQMGDGHLNKCIECTKADVRRHRRLNDSVREYDRKRGNRQKDQSWRKADPKRSAAHNAVSRALRCGKLKREPCHFCAADFVHAHHKDYDKPLEVMWLCPRCHHRLHAIEKAA